jgi:hypothetical protein
LYRGRNACGIVSISFLAASARAFDSSAARRGFSAESLFPQPAAVKAMHAAINSIPEVMIGDASIRGRFHLPTESLLGHMAKN